MSTQRKRRRKPARIRGGGEPAINTHDPATAKHAEAVAQAAAVAQAVNRLLCELYASDTWYANEPDHGRIGALFALREVCRFLRSPAILAFQNAIGRLNANDPRFDPSFDPQRPLLGLFNALLDLERGASQPPMLRGRRDRGGTPASGEDETLRLFAAVAVDLCMDEAITEVHAFTDTTRREWAAGKVARKLTHLDIRVKGKRPTARTVINWREAVQADANLLARRYTTILARFRAGPLPASQRAAECFAQLDRLVSYRGVGPVPEN